jgi:ABC-type nitrate/sulfonate/bicarbonate transport system substrate-binding protein
MAKGGAGARFVGLAILCAAAAAGSPARAAETVAIGLVGAVSSSHWPIYIALEQGYFAAEDIKLDQVFTQSNAAMLQQLAAGSLDIALSGGLVDPIRAIDKGAALAIVRLDMQVPPYELLGKPPIKRIEDLKGKVVSLGGPKDITRIFVERMLGPHGVKPGEFDMVFAGATTARFSALQSGAVDAAILLPPYNFYAESAGFTNLGLTKDYAGELPFSGSIVGRAWASTHRATLDKLLAIYGRAIDWFFDPKNRDAAINLMVAASKGKAEDVVKSYDFMRNNDIFERTGKVSRTKMIALINALRELGDVEGATDLDRFMLPGVTQMTD